jgi:glycosyltransferase involved in cell wall biosynthesis
MRPLRPELTNSCGTSTPRPRLLVVSHPAVLAVNQAPYAELRLHGWDPFLVTPSVWRNAYATGSFGPEVMPELSGHVAGRRVVLAGRHQRHLYVTRVAKLIAAVRPRVAFVEEEPTSAAAVQWGYALSAAGVPFGVQADENLDRAWPLPARAFRRWTLAHAGFVAARSPSAAALVRKARASVNAPVIPHHVPAWREHTAARTPARDRFVVGYAGRLVPEKGLDLLIEAVAGLDGVSVRLVGNGPLREPLRKLAVTRRVQLEIDTTVRHEDMAGAYESFDVLVLPSRTTATWAEQFGRVLVEALWCGVPVVGSETGEIPWVINSTGGGLMFADGDVDGLRGALQRLRSSSELRSELAVRGGARARELFSVEAVARGLNLALRNAAGRPVGAQAVSSS